MTPATIAGDQAFFTIVTKSHLAYARALAAQLKKFHPGVPLRVFLADNPDGFFDPAAEDFPVVLLREYLPEPLLETMPGYYTVGEFCNALKAFAHLHLAAQAGLQRWLYLDADIYVCGSFDRILAMMDAHSVVLTPHILFPGGIELAEEVERAVLEHGIYNGGFVGIRKTANSLAFLEWWKERLTWLCLLNASGLSADQTWLNFVPVLFAGVYVLRDPAVNVAYWNLHERELYLAEDETVSVAGNPVPFLHLSGWDWQTPGLVSRNIKVQPERPQPVWNRLTRQFLELLMESQIKETSVWPYSFSKARNGASITPKMRRCYWELLKNKKADQTVSSLFENPEVYVALAQASPSIRTAGRNLLGAIKHRFIK